MDFSLSESQRDLKALAAQIMSETLTQERLRQIDSQPVHTDEALWKQLAASGLLGIAVDERYGGMGFDFESLCLLIEEGARNVAPLPLIPALVGAALPIARWGSESQCAEWLPGLVNGEHLLSVALAEPGNADPATPATRAERAGEGWTLSGVKHCVAYAAQSSAWVVSAVADDGPGLFLVRADAGGAETTAQQDTSGEPLARLALNAAPGERLASGVEALSWLALRLTAAWCAFAVGLCGKMLRITSEYTSEREQFGVKIATFQAVGQRAADCFIDIEFLTAVTQRAVATLNEEADADEAGDRVRMAKIWAGDVAHRVSHAAQHLHGGCGVDRDYMLFRYCLWAKQLELAMGSSGQLLDQLGDDLAERLRAEALAA